MSTLPGLRARRRRWMLFALPALVLRALIPAGFMPVADAQGFALELCPDAAPLPPGLALAADPHAHHHHHDHAAGHDHGAAAAHHHAPCLFAASATLASAPAAAALTAPLSPAADALPLDPGARPFVPSILRSQSPRAPPLPLRL